MTKAQLDAMSQLESTNISVVLRDAGQPYYIYPKYLKLIMITIIKGKKNKLI